MKRLKRSTQDAAELARFKEFLEKGGTPQKPSEWLLTVAHVDPDWRRWLGLDIPSAAEKTS
jgi:hypothetical protein